ncbi:MAG TPA: MFS transporter [Nocardioidaceae bacterium]|nr:MFS transporter [Nocardioidaceae bacterium]
MSTPGVSVPGDEVTRRRRRFALVVIAVAQLMVVLDATIVNIALPQAQTELGIGDADRQWVVTAYTLTFGGLLLLGGRVADRWGRKRSFIVGLVGFAAASAVGGLATGGGLLFASRGLQGVFGALLAPAALSLLSVLFVETRERAAAFAVFGAVSGGGSAIGLLLGGVLTEYTSWRWCLLVNVPIALLAVLGALRALPADQAGERSGGRYDVSGAVLVTLGLTALVFGFTTAAEDGWSAPVTIGVIALAAVLLVAFVIVERRAGDPLLPLDLLLDRDRGGAYLYSLFVGATVAGSLLFLTFAMQAVLGYTPLQAGSASLAITVGVLVGSTAAGRLVPRVGPRAVLAAGASVSAGGLLLLSRFTADSTFLGLLLPAQLVLGVGLGMSFVTAAQLGLTGTPDRVAGAASAVVNASQQVGASLGTALLNTLATTAFAARLATDPPAGAGFPAEAAAHSYATAFGWAAVLSLAAAAIALLVVRPHRAATTNTTSTRPGGPAT